MFPRIAPFAAYLVFLGMEQGLSWIWPTVGDSAALWLYPAKIAVVIALLLYFRPHYREMTPATFRATDDLLWGLVVGVAVYVAWVRMDWGWAVQGNREETGYDPFRARGDLGMLLATIRIFGAAAVVPVMEELFWRSFLTRYLISSRFETIPLGTFTPFSFAVTVILFGLEHDLWLAGMLAGVAYNALLYHTKRLWPCIVAHSTTNLVLGIHVLVTHEWKWW